MSLLAFFLLGCATAKVNWDARIGAYSFDQAVLDYGPPDKSAKLADGTQVCEWLLQRGQAHGGYAFPMGGSWMYHYWTPPSPDYYLRLTFSPAGKLQAWRKVVK